MSLAANAWQSTLTAAFLELLIVVGHPVTLLDTYGPSSLNRFQTFLVFDIRQYVIKKWSRENNWE